MKFFARISDRAAQKTALGLLALALALLAAALGLSLGRDPARTAATYAMGAYIQQTVYGGEKAAGKALQAGAAAATRLDELLSWRIEGSDIARLNGAPGGEALSIDPFTWQVLSVCGSVSECSGGAFDATILPLSRLWDFDGDPHVPEEAALSAALSQVDYHALSLPGKQQAALAEGHALDLGAVGKGAACDAILAAYGDTGIRRAIVAVGGSVGLWGSKAWGQPWRVAIRDPKSNGSLGELSLRSGCVSTSGSYEKTFTENGRAYHHLLDPRTGFPADSGLVSVTVWRGEGDGLDGAYTDALSTACFVLGIEQSLPLLERCGAEAVFITEEGAALPTKGLAKSFALTSSDYTVKEVQP